MKLHIFNPDTDYALSAGTASYTPPKSIVKLAAEMWEIPKMYADSDDIVIAYSDIKYLKEILSGNGLKIEDIDEIRPWGWNRALKHSLKLAGVPERLLMSDEHLEILRNLSHRRTTINANKLLNKMICEAGLSAKHLSPIPIEFSEIGKAIDWIRDCDSAVFFKAPWSSSGRGILDVRSSNFEQAVNWISGVIRRQGSVIGEIAANKKIDFATEWMLTDKGVSFIGYSLFETSSRGKYKSNSLNSQNEIISAIQEEANDFGIEWVEMHRRMLEKLILPGYRGPVGIDMMSCSDASIRACVEINLRMTMGMVALQHV